MLLPVGEDLPEPREELDPGPLSQRRGDVTQLDQSVQESPRLNPEQRKDNSCCLSKRQRFPRPRGLQSTADLLPHWLGNCIQLMFYVGRRKEKNRVAVL